jgi:hypothetical protein
MGQPRAWIVTAIAAFVFSGCGGGGASSAARDLNQVAGRLPQVNAVSSVLPDLRVRLAPDGRSWSTGKVEGAQRVALRQWFSQSRSEVVQPGQEFASAAGARVATLPLSVTEGNWAKGQVSVEGQVPLTPPADAPTDLVETFDSSGDQYQASFFLDHTDYWMELIANRSPQHDADFNELVTNWLLQLHLT